MKTYCSSFQNKRDNTLYGILIITAVLAALFVVKNIKISPDSMRFGLVSQQIISGNGIRAPLIRLEDNYVPVNGAVPFLDQAPLLPIIFAALGGVTPQTYLPAQIVNVISHVFIAILTFLLMTNLYGNKIISMLTGILVSVSYPLLSVTHHISSEPLFIALAVAAVYFLILSRQCSYNKLGRNLLTAGICAVVAIWTRNAGIFLVPVFGWQAFMLVRNRRPEFRNVSAVLAITLPVIATVGLFVRNYLISGRLRGFTQPSPERSLLEAFTGTVSMLFEQFQLGINSSALIISFIILLVLFIVLNTDSRKEISKYFSAGLDLIIISIISYTALICLTMATQQWHFELRYMSPMVPFLFIIGIFLIVFVWNIVKNKGFSRLSLYGAILSLGIITFGSFYKTYLNLPGFAYKQQKAYSILQSCTYHWIKENFSTDNIIATNRPYHLSFFGGYSTLILPHKRFNPNLWVPDDMESLLPARMARFNARILALFDEAAEQYDGPYLAGLFNYRKDDDKFAVAYECPDGVVYKLK